MKKGDKYYEAWILNAISVRYSEYTIKKVTKDGVWMATKYEGAQYWSLVELELNFGKTKQEAIKKRIQNYQKYMNEYKSMIKTLKKEEEKLNEER